MKKFFPLMCGVVSMIAFSCRAVDMPPADYAPPFKVETSSPEDEVLPPVHTPQNSIVKENLLLPEKSDESVQIVAVVNDKIITTQDLEERMRMMLRGDLSTIPPKELTKIRADILRQMIDEKLQMEITENAKIVITDEDIQSAMRYMEEQNGLPAGSIEKDLKEKNISQKTIRDHFGAKIAWSRLISYYRDTIEVGKKDLFTRVQNEDLREKAFLLAELVFYFENIMDEEDAHQKAEEALARLRNGESFSQVAYETSEAPSAASGGDIGWVPFSQCEPSIQRALLFLKPGVLSQPIKGKNAYRILLVRNVKHPHSRAQTLTARQLEIKFSPTLSAEDRAKEKERLDGLFATIEGCEQFDLLEDQLGGELHIYQDVSLPDLSDDLQAALKDLPIGQPSPGYENEDSLVYFMVCDRRIERVQSINQEAKTDELVNQRLSAFADQKLRDLRRVASIEIRI